MALKVDVQGGNCLEPLLLLLSSASSAESCIELEGKSLIGNLECLSWMQLAPAEHSAISVSHLMTRQSTFWTNITEKDERIGGDGKSGCSRHPARNIEMQLVCHRHLVGDCAQQGIAYLGYPCSI